MEPDNIIELRKKYGISDAGVASAPPKIDRSAKLDAAWGPEEGTTNSLKDRAIRLNQQMQPVRDVINQTAETNTRLSKDYKPLAAGTQQVLNTGAGALMALGELPAVRKVTRPIGDAFSNIIKGAQDLGGEAIYKTAKMFNDKAFQDQNESNDQIFEDLQAATGNLATITGTAAGIKQAPTAIGKAAVVTGVDVIPDKVINYAKELPGKLKDASQARNIQSNVRTLEKIDSSYAGMRKLDAKNRAYDQKPRQAAAESGYLYGAVDENGVIRTIQENGAVERMRKERIDPVEATVAEKLAEENRSIAVADVVKKLTENIKASGVKGVELKNALNSIQGDIDGLMISARDMGAPTGTIPVSLLHETKIAKGKSIDYTNLSAQDVGKARVRAFKELVENNADFDVRKVNKGLSEHYALDEYLRKLDGKRVEGGRLGKYGAKVGGSAVGGALGALFGPVGSAAGVLIGSEVGQALKERSMKNTFSKGAKEFTQPVVKPESPTLLLSENASKINAISKDAIPVLPRDSFGETTNPNVVPAVNSGKPISTRIQNSTPTQGFDPLKMKEPRLPAGDYTTSNGRMYQPTVEQEAMFRDIEVTQDLADNLPNIVDELNNMDKAEAVNAIDEAAGELETSLSIIEQQLGEMTPEKKLYILRKQMKEDTFQDRDFNPRSGNKLQLNSKGYADKSDTTAKRNSLLEALQEQGRMYGFDNWDQNADMANAAADIYQKTRDAYIGQKAALDVLLHKKKLMTDQSMSRKTTTRSIKNTINDNIDAIVPETTTSVKPKGDVMGGYITLGGEVKDVSRFVNKADPYSGAAALLDNTDRKPLYSLADAIAKKETITRQMIKDADSVIEKINKANGSQLINPNGTDMSLQKQITLLRQADDALTKKAIAGYDKAQAKLGTQKKSPEAADDLVSEAKKYKSAEEFVKAQGTPKTAKVWIKSKFSGGGGYADVPITRKEDSITLYQGGIEGDKRQFWTPNKKYAEQFGSVKEKTGTFYKIDNGNRVTDVYIEAPTKSQLTEIWNKANKKK